jgi:hypothetical protein
MQTTKVGHAGVDLVTAGEAVRSGQGPHMPVGHTAFFA